MNRFQESTRKQIQNTFNKTQGTTQSNNNYFCLLTACIASKSQETATQETAEGDFCLNAFWEKQKQSICYIESTQQWDCDWVVSCLILYFRKNEITFKRIQALQIKSWLHLLLQDSLKQIFHCAYSDDGYWGLNSISTTLATSVNQHRRNEKGFLDLFSEYVCLASSTYSRNTVLNGALK